MRVESALSVDSFVSVVLGFGGAERRRCSRSSSATTIRAKVATTAERADPVSSRSESGWDDPRSIALNFVQAMWRLRLVESRSAVRSAASRSTSARSKMRTPEAVRVACNSPRDSINRTVAGVTPRIRAASAARQGMIVTRHMVHASWWLEIPPMN